MNSKSNALVVPPEIASIPAQKLHQLAAATSEGFG
jgi:hypothetical protein